MNLNLHFKDHRIEPAPFNVKLVYIRLSAEGHTRHECLTQPVMFLADLYDESLPTADSDGYTALTDYTNPEFDVSVGCDIEVRIDNGSDLDVIALGYEFKSMRILYALWTDEVAAQIEALGIKQ